MMWFEIKAINEKKLLKNWMNRWMDGWMDGFIWKKDFGSFRKLLLNPFFSDLIAKDFFPHDIFFEFNFNCFFSV